jgi:hypothetical protein
LKYTVFEHFSKIIFTLFNLDAKCSKVGQFEFGVSVNGIASQEFDSADRANFCLKWAELHCVQNMVLLNQNLVRFILKSTTEINKKL